MKGEVICTVCGHVGKVKNLTKGSFMIELLMWIFFIIPGIIYTIWRLTTQQKVCSKCNSPSIIPVDTPKGQELLKKGK